MAATGGAAVAGGAGWALGVGWLAAAGLLSATAFAGAFAVYLIVTERRRHESVEDHLQAQASFLESLVESISALAGLIDVDEAIARTSGEARRLFDAAESRFLPAGEAPAGEAAVSGTSLVVPLDVRGERVGAFVLERQRSFDRLDLIRAKVLVDFAARAIEIARLLGEAREREDERARLSERLITAEQDERRRLALFLHDGPLQSMSGIALMHDAALAAIGDGRPEDAVAVLARTLERERETIRTLRDLTFAIEPLVLRDHGFAAAVRALGEQIEQAHRITVSADVDAGDRLGEKAQVALYQVVRESLAQAVRRRPEHVDVTVAELAEEGFLAEIADNGVGERRRASIEAIDERVRILNARLAVEHGARGGTTVRVHLPAHVAAPGSFPE